MPPRESRPEFFIDRSLGKRIATQINERGFTVHTLESAYGVEAAPRVADIAWLAKAGAEGWIVLAKDKRIALSVLEKEQIEASGAKVFCLTQGNLPGVQQNARIVSALPRIVELARGPGPYIYGIYKSGVFLIWRPAAK